MTSVAAPAQRYREALWIVWVVLPKSGETGILMSHFPSIITWRLFFGGQMGLTLWLSVQAERKPWRFRCLMEDMKMSQWKAECTRVVLSSKPLVSTGVAQCQICSVRMWRWTWALFLCSWHIRNHKLGYTSWRKKGGKTQESFMNFLKHHGEPHKALIGTNVTLCVCVCALATNWCFYVKRWVQTEQQFREWGVFKTSEGLGLWGKWEACI